RVSSRNGPPLAQVAFQHRVRKAGATASSGHNDRRINGALDVSPQQPAGSPRRLRQARREDAYPRNQWLP
ncbi:hypothetical protein ACFL5O_11060, partial [Myxococcota bacterium]